MLAKVRNSLGISTLKISEMEDSSEVNGMKLKSTHKAWVLSKCLMVLNIEANSIMTNSKEEVRLPRKMDQSIGVIGKTASLREEVLSMILKRIHSIMDLGTKISNTVMAEKSGNTEKSSTQEPSKMERKLEKVSSRPIAATMKVIL